MPHAQLGSVSRWYSCLFRRLYLIPLPLKSFSCFLRSRYFHSFSAASCSLSGCNGGGALENQEVQITKLSLIFCKKILDIALSFVQEVSGDSCLLWLISQSCIFCGINFELQNCIYFGTEGVLVYRQPVKISTQAFMIVHVSSEHTVGPGNKKLAMSEPSSSERGVQLEKNFGSKVSSIV